MEHEAWTKWRVWKEQRATGLRPLLDFRLKAALRRDSSPALAFPSDSRLQPEVCEGLSARVHEDWAACRLSPGPAMLARLAMPPIHTPRN